MIGPVSAAVHRDGHFTYSYELGDEALGIKRNPKSA